MKCNSCSPRADYTYATTPPEPEEMTRRLLSWRVRPKKRRIDQSTTEDYHEKFEVFSEMLSSGMGAKGEISTTGNIARMCLMTWLRSSFMELLLWAQRNKTKFERQPNA
ncbi:hypothetical protein CIHG_09221 [Coccidioides immitis H538.4]|uniref:Uncharacterized protein n=2 Tax=Coccidioides immitis TaxID=5501 RepID=A0A0J8S4Q4_COCIT|nr:hypothetical protein CIRG_05981 [Coccidioides immitis RMSCC 2394]KMU91344.1 hypothetical protein CIHG_09221 [Coccidioides immitis H538.4]